MRHGRMGIGEFEGIVKRHAYERFNGCMIYKGREGKWNEAPTGTATLTFGAWDEGHWFNIPCPDLPEHNQLDGDKLLCHGWRHLLKDLVHSRYIRPADEIAKLLGPKDARSFKYL